ncbi:MAG TPA: RNA polymerase factor sigma-54 [Candidatus Paceibacterota bacterium]|nr:RNA polymerase factor sigma-54 [Verrucomicrobiota bacterium]HRY49011.1 RNA polymerase factor sigma-54 [Candidatus Paceibacterota bacterium]HRZ99520.1 RNA polymerase factor sigma-54 [Candidatus Paceibacterota bacterium]
MAQGLYLSQKMALAQVLAPQLQQSLALLQAPTLELKALVEQELQQNPVLEEVPSLEPMGEERVLQMDSEGMGSLDPAEPPSDVILDPVSEQGAGDPVDDFQAEFEKLAQIDQEWRDQFGQTNAPLRQVEEEEEKRQYMFDSLVAGSSLQENLLSQVRLSDLPEELRPVSEMIIGNIDDRGYLQASQDELAFATNIPVEKISEVLRLIQTTFYPPGVGARDLRECLMLQLERAGKQESLEYRMLRDHMEALGKRRFPEIARLLELSLDDVQDAAARIARLEPNPGREFMTEASQYVVPEITVRKVADEYVVTNNSDHIPHLRISNTYKDLMAQAASSSEVRDYIRDKIRAGKFLIKSLYQRQETILNIAREIVNRQREFMDHGVSHLKPLTMMQVAEVVGVHETTVSRAVSGKYMDTPQGIYEMKYFFTSGVKTATGEGVSNTTIKDKIADMIRKEDQTSPLSDDQIVKVLQQQGINIARRTVAKYRSELNILPSNLRKVY